MKLALGTVQFGIPYGVANEAGQVSYSEVAEILQHARSAGFDTLDTAIAYGNSESILGQIGVNSWKVVTKLPAVQDSTSDIRKWVTQQTGSAMRRLGVSKLHGLLLHRPNQLFDKYGAELYASLSSLKAEGLVNKIGVSVYEPQELDRLCQQFEIDIVQCPLNILDRRLIDSGWAAQLKDAGVELHTRSCFLQGLLLLTPSKRPAKFNHWKYIWYEWERWLAHTGLTPLQACLRYTNSIKDVYRVLVGVDSVGQIDEIIEATAGPLDSLPVFMPLHDTRLVDPASWNTL
jgi:aryl-alcohol dehydrogenase-like predicted oxidoreductase